MAEYKPRRRNKHINPRWGYYISPLDDNILLPDIKKLEALEYALRMRAKEKTPIRDCCMWLHAQTGQKITPAGFFYMYQNWLKRLKKERGKEIMKKAKEVEKKMQEDMKEHNVFINDSQSILALAHGKAKENRKKKEKV